MRGSREQRAVLIRGPNKVVAIAVVGSPKLNVSEVETYARMGSVQEEVLRVIGTSRQWLRHLTIVVALVSNPKTPLAVSMPLVPRLPAREMRRIASDRNVADGVRITARRCLMANEERRS
ncbi:MAG: hypothetical protein VYE68_15530 [Acidobacteriota bacterium]|nr:hypothetical protein [Acidobacteriota bacterium]